MTTPDHDDVVPGTGAGTVRVAASYHASDGSTPESIEVTWEDGAQLPDADSIVAVVAALAAVPRGRDVWGVAGRLPRPEGQAVRGGSGV